MRPNYGVGGEKLVWSNAAEVEARVAAINAALSHLEFLYREVLTDEDLKARFETLRASLPVVPAFPDHLGIGAEHVA